MTCFARVARLLPVLPIAALLLPATAWAQASSADESAAGVATGDIVVTARKRDERVQDVPLALSVLSGGQLQQRGIASLQDVFQAVPGISFQGNEPGRGTYAIRGISTSTEIATVGFYMDDVPLPARLNELTGAAAPDVLDLQRVEVLKGPQGTLYGAGAMGGAIKFVANPPRLDAFAGEVTGEAGTTRGGAMSYQLGGVLNLPVVTDHLAVRIAARQRRDGGYVDRIANGLTEDPNRAAVDGSGRAIGLGANGQPLARDADGYVTGLVPASHVSANTVNDKNVNRYDTTSARISALWQPDATISITPAFYYQRIEGDDTSYYFKNLPGFQQSNQLATPTRDKMWLASLTMKKSFDTFDIVSVTGRYARDQYFVEDISEFVGAQAAVLSTIPSDRVDASSYRYFTQELRIGSSAPSRLQWVLGGFYQREKVTFEQTAHSFGVGGLIGLPPLNGEADVVYHTRIGKSSDQYAIFGEASYNFTDQLSFTGGLRWFDIKQDLNRLAEGLFAGATIRNTATSKEDGFNPKFLLSFKATPRNLLYASVSKGFRQGDGNYAIPNNLCAADLAALGRTEAPGSYKSDSLWNYELGSKNTVLGGALTVNGSLFYIDWRNIQQQVRLPGCGFSFTANVGNAISRGGELEITARPTRNTTINFALTGTFAKITDSVTGVKAQDGDPVLLSPKWVITAGAEQTFPLTDMLNGFVRADYQYRSSQWRSFDRILCVAAPGATVTSAGCAAGRLAVRNGAQIQDAYGVANFSLGVSTDRYTLRLFVNNVFDSKPILDYVTSYNYQQVNSLRPRTVGLAGKFGF